MLQNLRQSISFPQCLPQCKQDCCEKSLTSPKVETSRALQRLAVISMSAFLLNRYQQLPADFPFAEFKRSTMINNFLETILAPYWIKEKTGKLQLREKKVV